MSRLEDAFKSVCAADIEDLDRPGMRALSGGERVEALGLDPEEFVPFARRMVGAAVQMTVHADIETFMLGVEIGRELMRQEWEEATRGDR